MHLRKHDKDLWQARGATPDWSLVDCNCTKPDKYDYGEEYGCEDDPLYPPQECSEGAWEGAKACVGLFTFGSAYGITPLREDALDRLCWYYNEVRTIGLAEIEDPAVGDDNWELTDPILPLPAKHCEHAYNQTPPGSPLRKLLVRAFCASHQPGHRGKFICVGFKTCCDFSTVYLHKDILQPVDPPQELLADVAACFASGVSSTYVVKGEDIACEKYPVLPPSDFHAHNSEQERQHCSKLPVDPNTRVHIEE
ncbi:uncharacterized protein CC84DRAFT_1175313 [Paraphaeosphaeria sporulosa]|uniref:Uncharacterized protein n=1 Tax=Paraphaeosphaeria sporulosa TaxID=1460663 RepID=A0A177CKY8_9PLEO|nr:uncharacterized protein CC84DRAFT_1175313 [Paraphaeosphaeria sporulosa]OAG07520.1 hypothetical protein CC84DRAFT_1175313 [Paraphaeosphaeria sporulosa]